MGATHRTLHAIKEGFSVHVCFLIHIMTLSWLSRLSSEREKHYDQAGNTPDLYVGSPEFKFWGRDYGALFCVSYHT
jgi:hypothetical protein